MTSRHDDTTGKGRKDSASLTRKSAPRAAQRSARLPADDRQLDLRDALAGALVRRVNDEAEREDRRAAEDAWEQGALLNELVDLGLSPDEVAEKYAAGPAIAHERMKIARATTRLLAGYWGLARVRLGLALMAKLKLSRMEQLEAIDLVTPSGKVQFPASVEQLQAALDVLSR